MKSLFVALAIILPSAVFASGEHCYISNDASDILKLSDDVRSATIVVPNSGDTMQAVVLNPSLGDAISAKLWIDASRKYPDRLFARTDLKKRAQISVTSKTEFDYVNRIFAHDPPEDRPYLVKKVVVMETTGDAKKHVYTTGFRRTNDQRFVEGLAPMSETQCPAERSLMDKLFH